jgi:4-hydroxy-tetrahydrodipicolinate synthase
MVASILDADLSDRKVSASRNASSAANRFHGVVPAMATPFAADQTLDERRCIELIDWYLDAGVHGISVAGSQGEFFSLEEREHVRLIEITVEHVNERVPVYAGTGRITTRESIRITKAAESIGADLALVITPFFVQPSQNELVEHYAEIAQATELPVMLYNNPPRTSTNILPATLVRCMNKAHNIVGVKDSSGDVTQSVEYKLITERRALLFSGRDTIALALFLHGADGTISPAANVFPSLVVKMYECVRQGDIVGAGKISDALAPLREAWAWGSFPVVIKEAMALVGKSAGSARRPIQPLTSDRQNDLKKVIANINEYMRGRSGF